MIAVKPRHIMRVARALVIEEGETHSRGGILPTLNKNRGVCQTRATQCATQASEAEVFWVRLGFGLPMRFALASVQVAAARTRCQMDAMCIVPAEARLSYLRPESGASTTRSNRIGAETR